MAATDGACAAPSDVTMEGEEHAHTLEMSPGHDAACEVTTCSQKECNGELSSDNFLSKGFEGHNRLYTGILQFYLGTVVLISVLFDDSNIREVGGTLSFSKVQFGVKDEAGEIVQFAFLAVGIFGALTPNIMTRHTQRMDRRKAMVWTAAVCLITVQAVPQVRGVSAELKDKADSPELLAVHVIFILTTAVLDILFLYLFGSLLCCPCCCCGCWTCCCQGKAEVQGAEEHWWSIPEALGMLWAGLKAAALFYIHLIAGGAVWLWGVVCSAGKVPLWIWGQCKWLWSLAVGRWESVREDASYQHSVWMLSALAVSGVAIIYFGVRIPVVWVKSVHDYEQYRDCIAERKGAFQDLLLSAGFGDKKWYYEQIFPGGITNDTARESLYLEMADGVGSPRARFQGRCSWPQYLDELYSLLGSRLDSSANPDDPRDPIRVFEETFTGRVMLYVDAAFTSSALTVWIGFAIATAIGINSLLSVLARYKTLTRMLVRVLPAKLPTGRQRLNWGSIDSSAPAARGSIHARATGFKTWEELNQAYSLNSASLFMGVWVSTAVFQLVLIGVTSTWILASFVAWHRLWALLSGAIPLVIVFLVLLVFDWIAGISSPLLDKAVFEDYQLKRPVIWSFYTLVRSVVGLAVGLLFAFWRLLLLLVTSFLNFNRLDKCVLPPRLDQGHKSLFSMAMMNAMLQGDDDWNCSDNKVANAADGSVVTNGPQSR